MPCRWFNRANLQSHLKKDVHKANYESWCKNLVSNISSNSGQVRRGLPSNLKICCVDNSDPARFSTATSAEAYVDFHTASSYDTREQSERSKRSLVESDDVRDSGSSPYKKTSRLLGVEPNSSAAFTAERRPVDIPTVNHRRGTQSGASNRYMDRGVWMWRECHICEQTHPVQECCCGRKDLTVDEIEVLPDNFQRVYKCNKCGYSSK